MDGASRRVKVLHGVGRQPRPAERPVSEPLFEHIRIENSGRRLFYITIDKNEFARSRTMGRPRKTANMPRRV